MDRSHKSVPLNLVYTKLSPWIQIHTSVLGNIARWNETALGSVWESGQGMDKMEMDLSPYVPPGMK
jgi:hypothetical protein